MPGVFNPGPEIDVSEICVGPTALQTTASAECSQGLAQEFERGRAAI